MKLTVRSGQAPGDGNARTVPGRRPRHPAGTVTGAFARQVCRG